MRLLTQSVLDRRSAELRQRVDALERPDGRGTPSARLAALADLARQRTAGFQQAAPWLMLEIDHATAALQDTLADGMPYDEVLAAALLSGAAAIGAGWPGDPRLCTAGTELAASLRALWRSSSGCVAARLTAAMERAETLHAPGADALARWLADRAAARAARNLRRAVFGDADAPGATVFEAAEAAALDAADLHDAALRGLCIAGDMAFGQGRCVRVACAAVAAGRPPFHDVIKACHGLVQDADR
jgi:hypothetical protein